MLVVVTDSVYVTLQLNQQPCTEETAFEQRGHICFVNGLVTFYARMDRLQHAVVDQAILVTHLFN